MPSIFNRRRPRVGLSVSGGPGTVNYRAVVTREFPMWNLTLTGGDLPPSGQVMTSMSFARLEGDVRDFLEWHQVGELNGWPSDPHRWGDDGEEDGDDGEDGAGEGWCVTYECRWPQDVKDALERYWAAWETLGKTTAGTETTAAIAETTAALGEPLCAIRDGLKAGETDVAALVCLPAEETFQIIMAYHEQEGFLRAGRTIDDWRAWREDRDRRRQAES